MSQLEQLQMILDCLCGGTKAEMMRRLGMKAPTTIQGWFQRGNFDVKRIAYAFPELSIDWLVFGNGPMFKADCRAEGYPTQSQDDINPDAPAPVDSGSATAQSPHGDSRPYSEQPSMDAQVYTVREGEAVDRALLNMLLAEKANLLQKISTLESRNLELEKQNAVLEARFAGATEWYYSAITKHPDLK